MRPACPTVPKITIAVVSWNTRGLLAECLDSLSNDDTRHIADVWVVDNASHDGSAELVRERFPWANLVASEENLGFGAAVNLVAARTSSEWIAPANADIRLEPGAVRRLLDEGARHPEAAVIAPRLLLPGGNTQVSVYPFPTIPFTLAYVCGAVALSRGLARHWCIERGFDRDRRQEVPWAAGAFMLIRRAAWDEVGGFDHSQWMYAEDLDLGWRLRRQGWTARYEPAARVLHRESAATILAWGDRRHDRWHASTYAWLLRRRGLAITRVIAAINVGGFMLRAILCSLGVSLGLGRLKRPRGDALNAAQLHRVGLRPRAVLERIR